MATPRCIRTLLRRLTQAVFCLAIIPAALPAAEVTLAWEAIRNPDAVLYRIYYRDAAGAYDFQAPLWEGAGTRCTLSDLTDGETHHFVGRSVDLQGNESDNSNEIVFDAPARGGEDPAAPSDPTLPVDTDPLVAYDAELRGGNWTQWMVLDDDPPGAGVVSTYDPLRQTEVTDLICDWINNSFQLSSKDGGPLAEGGGWRLVWDMKADLYYFVSVVLQTSAGERTLYYTPSDFDLLGRGPSIHHGLGIGSVDGRWHTHERHLDQDLEHAQPGLFLEGVQAVQIRGRASVDDIFLAPVP